ncbi:hypothetical protein EHI8A_040160 [Entamoeba histolytica HM-1:IMSS-B]|uniref:Flavin reductase like domain-containing protein n=6 Tax=Entamoeba histolytica TaxID=5759 RepID=C4LV62_ENTH1|nr:hypothetical protein EHI_182820 [Entamoeba histolytica HM-1:IMSS]EMD45067.1 Hypothetical protein EHI5A_001700 [Entamoeba histolytica KU27]EMH74329.1 hypothetical protein EHI8A_040160 [Entamoeba histolytica HM-1:IMSS-B]EMS10719.1 hypothetical protein KM1_002390 [Entamoeba histolytica HM-3:IMSS]ENY63913.1 hypothetical protein EHI7A_021530 [Entamoeba histolytica HM-1:IMSS-A]GAT92545.1 hypothetical protein CL6EHI_182820 [Entamoeba histolytica]|eukprot:XP_655483.1 hypothetical protein EHI_182820 [Entamoeba histolytica HM-1:IMSS]
MTKVQVNLKFATRLINEHCIVIPTVYDKYNHRVTGMSAQWVMPTDKQHIAVLFGAFSNTGKLIEESTYYCINVPRTRSEKDIVYFGMNHGDVIDKFAHTSFHLENLGNEQYRNLSICESIAVLHMKVSKVVMVADECELQSRLIFGEIVDAYVDPCAFDGEFYQLNKVIEEDRPLHCINETGYCTIKPIY